LIFKNRQRTDIFCRKYRRKANNKQRSKVRCQMGGLPKVPEHMGASL